MEYAHYNSNKPIGVAIYDITQNLPRELVRQLLQLQQMIVLLQDID